MHLPEPLFKTVVKEQRKLRYGLERRTSDDASGGFEKPA